MGKVLNFEVSEIYHRNFNADSDLIINRGGTSSTKTFSLAQLFITFLLTQPDKKMLVCRKYTPALKLTVMADFFELLKKYGIYEKGHFNKTDKVFTYSPTGSIIHFQGIDEPQKLKGVNFNYVWMNEADEFSFEEFNQLYLRLRRASADGLPNKIFLDFNPSDAYTWIRTKLEDAGRGFVIHSTYHDNPFLDAATVRKIKELEATDASFWSIYGLGEYTTIKGLIYENYEIVNSWPGGPMKWEALGLDFGFSNDETALIKVGSFDGCLWLDEVIYKTGLLNKDISERIKANKAINTLSITADSSEPKSIRELQTYGHRIKGVKKGPDSIRWGINSVKQFPIKVTSRSTNLIKEIRAYKWATKRNGETTGKPIDKFNHALDAVRYVVMEKLGRPTGFSYLKGK